MGPQNEGKMREDQELMQHLPYVTLKVISSRAAVTGSILVDNRLPDNSIKHQHPEGASSMPDPTLSIPLLLFHLILTPSP